MTLVEAVRLLVDDKCLGHKCSKQGCKIPLKEAPQNRLIIDFDIPNSPLGADQRRCDYLFIASVSGKPGWVVPPELKNGPADVHKIAGQLQAGANAADGLVPNGEQFNFRPVVATRGIHTQQKKMLSKCRVRLRDQSALVKLITCGTPLAQVLKP